jgi:Uncharacterized conserved protein
MLTYFRIAKTSFASDLSGEGARRVGGRWNERLVPALYTASSVSLALLEILVHVGDAYDLPEDLSVSVIEVNDASAKLETVYSLPATLEEAQQIGTAALKDLTILGLFVPSVVIPTEQNLVLNPRAERFAEWVRIADIYPFKLDRRLR